MRAMRQIVLLFLLLSLSAVQADTLVNWELGFEIDVPTTWLRQEGGANGLKLASEDVKLDIVPFSGLTLTAQIERLHKQTKADGYQFKSERSYALHEVPAHEMVFYKDGEYKIYHVLLAGSRGFLLTLRSQGMDSEAFKESQAAIGSFRVKPIGT